MIQLSVQGWECMPCLQRSPILSCYLATLPVSGAVWFRVSLITWMCIPVRLWQLDVPTSPFLVGDTFVHRWLGCTYPSITIWISIVIHWKVQPFWDRNSPIPIIPETRFCDKNRDNVSWLISSPYIHHGYHGGVFSIRGKGFLAIFMSEKPPIHCTSWFIKLSNVVLSSP